MRGVGEIDITDIHQEPKTFEEAIYLNLWKKAPTVEEIFDIAQEQNARRDRVKVGDRVEVTWGLVKKRGTVIGVGTKRMPHSIEVAIVKGRWNVYLRPDEDWRIV